MAYEDMVLRYIENNDLSGNGIGTGSIQYGVGIESSDLVDVLNELIAQGLVEFVSLQLNDHTDRPEAIVRSVRKISL